MHKSSRVKDSQEEANVTQLQYVSKLLCPMSRHWRTLDYVFLCFLILSAASSCWCIVKIAAGGKSSGSGKSRGGLVRIVFWPIFLDEQLVPGRSWALCSRGTEGVLLSCPPGSEMCVRCKAFHGEGATVGMHWARGKADRSQSGWGWWQQLIRKGVHRVTHWHLLAWLKGCPIAVL